MEQENKKKKIIVAIIGVVILLVVVAGATLAFFSATDIEEVKQITTAKEELDVKINGSTHVSNIKPVKVISSSTTAFGDNRGCIPENNDSLVVYGYAGPVVLPCKISATSNNKKNKDVVTIPINVTSKSTIDINYNLIIQAENLKLKNDLNGGTTEDIKWILYQIDSENGESNSIVSGEYSGSAHGDFYNPTYEQKMVSDVLISPNDTDNYLLFIYIEDTELEQNKLQNLEFDVKIAANTDKPNIVGRDLKDVILENNVIKDREPNFKINRYMYPSGEYLYPNDDGLFKISGKDIYYFRGVLRNNSANYLYFGRHKADSNLFVDVIDDCPILWQIVRINEDGSIVLAATEFGFSKKDISLTTENGKPDYVGSSIQQELEKWFNNTFSNEEQSMIKETTYCNDRSDNYTAVNKRLNKENPEPTLECKDEKDRIKSKVGLLTADELVYAGYFPLIKSQNSGDFSRVHHTYGSIYFYNSISNLGGNFMSMSPYSTDSFFKFNSNKVDGDRLGFVSSSETSNINLIPVITLNPGVTISKGATYKDNIVYSGLGLYQNPYAVGYDE